MVPLFQRMSLQGEEALDNTYADPHLPDIIRIFSTKKKKKSGKVLSFPPIII